MPDHIDGVVTPRGRSVIGGILDEVQDICAQYEREAYATRSSLEVSNTARVRYMELLNQQICRIDGVETAGEIEVRIARKEAVQQIQQMQNRMDCFEEKEKTLLTILMEVNAIRLKHEAAAFAPRASIDTPMSARTTYMELLNCQIFKMDAVPVDGLDELRPVRKAAIATVQRLQTALDFFTERETSLLMLHSEAGTSVAVRRQEFV